MFSTKNIKQHKCFQHR